MKRVLVALCVALALAVTAEASYYDFEQITVDNTSGGKGFTLTKISTGAAPMSFAQCRLETAEVRYLYVDPSVTAVTASVGTLLEPGDYIVFTNREDMVNFRAIRTGATSGVLDCLYKGVR